jgi:hypothetical protein
LRKASLIIISFAVACIAGFVVQHFTSSATATYGVGVVAMAAAVAALFGIDSAHQRSIKSKIKAKHLKNTTITGVRADHEGSGDISSTIDVASVDDGEVTGVEE